MHGVGPEYSGHVALHLGSSSSAEGSIVVVRQVCGLIAASLAVWSGLFYQMKSVVECNLRHSRRRRPFIGVGFDAFVFRIAIQFANASQIVVEFLFGIVLTQ